MPNDWSRTAVLVFACNRPAYLQRSLNSIFSHMADHALPVFVSQDGTHKGVSKVIQSWSPNVYHLQHMGRKQYTLSRHVRPGYFHIALHYKWALGRVFGAGYRNVIVLEDDLEIASDFYDYFRACLPLLEQDPSIWTISAWNDFGYGAYARDPKRLYRSDFFPGLGWLMTDALWRELGESWPDGFWDEWMRKPKQRQGRVAIRPEVSRTYTFGKKGVSGGQYFNKFLRNIRLNPKAVDFKAMDLSYLLKDKYDTEFQQAVSNADRVKDPAGCIKDAAADQKLVYRNADEFKRIAKQFGLMWDFWSDVPRTAYQGVVVVPNGNYDVFIVPDNFEASIPKS
ncbi:MAG: hypothetical protein OEZ68_17450 [Gammaproteobacteria bacterium]|nr:hypothetical protein [Gammaproteobacteria bacterium]MDH5802590.1 hypothetical protein [Gammaproteobacteria bacterium]